MITASVSPQSNPLELYSFLSADFTALKVAFKRYSCPQREPLVNIGRRTTNNLSLSK